MTQELVLFVLISGLGVLVGTTMGFASALVAVPLLALFMPPQTIVPAFTLLTLLTNMVVIVEGRQHLRWKQLVWLIGSGIAGTVVGAGSLAYLPTRAIRIVVGVTTVVFGLLFLRRRAIALHESRGTEIGVGLFSGWLGGCIAQSGPPFIVYALARRWEKEPFRVNSMAFFTPLSAIAMLSYWRLNLLSAQTFVLTLAALVPALLASAVGLWIKTRVNETTFRMLAIGLILLVGVIGLVQALIK
jgi:uncharacterized membrane protein YfcA